MDADVFLMHLLIIKILICTYASLFLSLLDMPKRYVSLSLGCQYFLIFLCTWSPRGEWPLSPLGNSLLLKSELYLYRIAGFTFPDTPTNLFPLNLFKGWPKS